MQYDDVFIPHKIDFYMGKPKSGKTLIAGSYPKPLLYISVGNDGGGRVLATKFRNEIAQKQIRVINLLNDPVMGGKINKTSIEKLADILVQLKKPEEDKFATIVIDTVGALQEDYKVKLETDKRGQRLNTSEWGDVSTMMLSIKDTMKRFSSQILYNGEPTQFVWIDHTREQEVYETSGLNKEIRIVPTLTINTGNKYLRDASNIFYCCRKTVINKDGSRDVKFLTYVGPHPLMDTGTRDILLTKGGFIENFTYDKWQACIKNQTIDMANVVVPEIETENDDDKKEE